MVLGSPSASQIRTAKRNAVGGMRKRCVKGKSCSATCIAGNEDCLVELPEPVSSAMQKARDNLAQGGMTTSKTELAQKKLMRKLQEEEAARKAADPYASYPIPQKDPKVKIDRKPIPRSGGLKEAQSSYAIEARKRENIEAQKVNQQIKMLEKLSVNEKLGELLSRGEQTGNYQAFWKLQEFLHRNYNNLTFEQKEELWNWPFGGQFGGANLRSAIEEYHGKGRLEEFWKKIQDNVKNEYHIGPGEEEPRKGVRAVLSEYDDLFQKKGFPSPSVNRVDSLLNKTSNEYLRNWAPLSNDKLTSTQVKPLPKSKKDVSISERLKYTNFENQEELKKAKKDFFQPETYSKLSLAQQKALWDRSGSVSGSNAQLNDYLTKMKGLNRLDLALDRLEGSKASDLPAFKKFREEMPAKPKVDWEKQFQMQEERWQRGIEKANLSGPEVKAIKNYTYAPFWDDKEKNSNYGLMNSNLRDKGYEDMSKSQRASVDTLDKAIEKIPMNTTRDHYFRGMLVPPEENMWSTVSRGDLISDPGFSSYSADRSIARKFYRGLGNDNDAINDDRVMIISRSPHLRNISPLSEIPDEQEGLLPRGQDQRVDWVKQTTDSNGQRTFWIGVDYYE